MNEKKPSVIVLVEDDQALCELLTEELESEGYTIHACNSAEDAAPLIEEAEPDLVVSDLQLPGANGLQVLEYVRKLHAPPAFLMITAYGTVDRAVQALKAGADNFLTKPLDMDHFTLTVERLLDTRRLRNEVQRFRSLVGEGGFHGLVGQSRVMRVLFDQTRRVARAEGPVLVTGPSGAGKELIARAVHEESDRAGKPFLAVNCAGVPAELLESEFFGHSSGAFSGAEKRRPGLFQEADGGTLFLDEIGEMPQPLQAKLLRALQDGMIRPVGADREIQVDVRVLAATNRDLNDRVQSGDFREDLYYRLETFSLHVPALSERPDDIDLLAASFLDQFANAHQRPARRIGESAMNALKAYTWPGNVRELRNAMERAVTFCEDAEIGLEHLPARIRKETGSSPELAADSDSPEASGLPSNLLEGDMLPSLDELRQRYVHYVLDKVDGNKRRAAALLGVGRRTLYRWLDES